MRVTGTVRKPEARAGGLRHPTLQPGQPRESASLTPSVVINQRVGNIHPTASLLRSLLSAPSHLRGGRRNPAVRTTLFPLAPALGC